MRTADYYRMSTDRQGESIPQQMAAVRQLCERERLAIVATYKDEGISGGENDRAELQRMIDQAKANRLEAIACYDLDRLSRSDAMAAMAEVFYPLKKAGVRWVVTKDGRIDLNDIVGQTMLGLRQNFSCHQEKLSIADRTTRGRYKLWLEGYWIGNKPPYGYRIANRRDSKLLGAERGAGKLRIEKGEAEEIAACFELYEQLKSSRAVGSRLGRSMYWVQEKLNRAVYCGRLIEPRQKIGKHFEFSLEERKKCEPGTGGRRWRAKDSDRWIEDIYPKIVSTSQFDRVQSIMKEVSLRGKGGAAFRRLRRDHLFSQIMYCGDCKRLMYGHARMGAREGEVYYYCGGYANNNGCTEPHTSPEHRIRNAVIRQVKADVERVGGLEAIRKTLMEAVETALDDRDERRRLERERLTKLEIEIAQARKGLLRLGAISDEIYRDAVADVERMMREREEMAQKLTLREQEDEYRLAWTRAVEATVAGLGTPPLQEKLLELVERIDIQWERREGERKRGKFRVTGGLIEYKSLRGFPRLAAFQSEVPQRRCMS